MFQLDEKVMASDRAIIAIAQSKDKIDNLLKPGMLNYVYNEGTGESELLLTIPRSKDYAEYNKIIMQESDGKVHTPVNFAEMVSMDKDFIVKGNMKVEGIFINDNGVRVTASKTEPQDPRDGDVWIDIS